MAERTEPLAPAWVGITYLIYIIAYETLMVGGCGYIVFVLGYSGWWFLLGGLFSAGALRPATWNGLWIRDIAKAKEAE